MICLSIKKIMRTSVLKKYSLILSILLSKVLYNRFYQTFRNWFVTRSWFKLKTKYRMIDIPVSIWIIIGLQQIFIGQFNKLTSYSFSISLINTWSDVFLKVSNILLMKLFIQLGKGILSVIHSMLLLLWSESRENKTNHLVFSLTKDTGFYELLKIIFPE